MWPHNPVLNEEEQELMDPAPEECLRRAVQRGALSLGEITAALSPRVAAAVRSIATGERPARLEGDPVRELGEADRSLAGLGAGDGPVRPATPPQAEAWEEEWTRGALSAHSHLVQLMDEQALTPSEAMAAAHAIDHALGRYLTGTRYAAP